MVSINSGENVIFVIPEGGWGYLITLSLTIAFMSTIVPLSSFGLIFGNFLKSIGDETTGTSLTNGIFLTVSSISGLATSHLLEKYPFRAVGFMGAALFSIGTFATVFVTSLPQLIISFGVIEGLGLGLLIPSCMTALTGYFDKKLNLMNSISQAVVTASMISFPTIVQYTREHFGFRGTLALISAFSLNTFLAASLLQPVKWHLKKIPIEPLLEPSTKSVEAKQSIINIADRAFSVTTLDKLREDQSFWKILAKSLNLNYFKDPVYMNISIGLALAFVSDISFLALIPLLLHHSGFDDNDCAFFMTVYFASDLVSRISLSVISAFCKLNNRLIFLANCFLLAVIRTSFLAYDTYIWKLCTISMLGFLRCFLQTPLPLVIADNYPKNFGTAFSLYMVVSGVVGLIFGPLISLIKSLTGSDAMVVHLLNAAYMTCVITWSVELIYKKIKTAKTYILVFNYGPRHLVLIPEKNRFGSSLIKRIQSIL